MEDVRFDLNLVISEFGHAQIGSLEKEVEGLIAAERFDEAQAVTRRILEVDQSNTKARQWRMQLQDLSRQQSLKNRVKGLLDDAERDAAQHNFSAAEGKLDQALRMAPGNPRLSDRIEQMRVEWRGSRRSAELVAEAQSELEREAFTSAFEHATAAVNEIPAMQTLRVFWTCCDRRCSAAKPTSGGKRP